CWKVTLHLGALAAELARGDEVTYCVDTSGGSAVALVRGGELRAALGDVVDLWSALTKEQPAADGFVRASVLRRSALALARTDLVADGEELAYWLGRYVGGRAVEGA